MNAHAPIAASSDAPSDDAPAGGHSRDGRPALDQQVLAVQNADLLRYLAAHPGASVPVLSQALERDPSNLRKTLQRLAREDLVDADAHVLTPAAEALIPRLDMLQTGRIAAGPPPLTWAQIRHDPNNPRTIVDAEADARLQENIARRGQKTPLLVRLDPDGKGGELTDGWRRWSAIGRLIAVGDPRWPADRPVLYFPADPGEASEVLADALITSLQKENLHPLDEAAAFGRLEAMGWSPAKILEETGVDRRYFEQRRDLLNLTPAQQARMRLPGDDPNHLSIKGARGLLQHLRQLARAPAEPSAQTDLEARTLDLTDKLQLALVEVAFAIEQKPGREPVRLAHEPSGGALATLRERQLVSVAAPVHGEFFAAIPKGGAAAAWLNDQGFHDDPAGAVFRARAAVLGDGKARQLAQQRIYATDELNTDPLVWRGVRFPNLTHLNEARRVAAGGGPYNSGGGSGQRTEEAGAEAHDPLSRSQRRILREISARSLHANRYVGGYVRVPLVALEDPDYQAVYDAELTTHVQDYSRLKVATSRKGEDYLRRFDAMPTEGLSPNSCATPWLRDDFEAAAANAPPEGEEAADADGDEPPALKPRHVLILTELAHKILTDPVLPPPLREGATRVGEHWLDGNLDLLVQDLKLVRLTNLGDENGWMASLTPAGWDRLGGAAVQAIGDEQLRAARDAVAQTGWPGPDYVTRWLNVKPPKAGEEGDLGEDPPGRTVARFDPPATEAEQGGEDEEEAADRATLAEVAVALSTGVRPDAQTVVGLLARLGLQAPFEAATGDNAGGVFDATDAEACTVDMNREGSDARAEAVARLIVAGLHLLAGVEAP